MDLGAEHAVLGSILLSEVLPGKNSEARDGDKGMESV